MTTLAQRLSQLSGLPLGAHTMAEHLRAMVTRFNLGVPASATVAAILIAYSGLPAGQHTVAEHLAVERQISQQVGGSRRHDDADLEQRVRDAWDEIAAAREADAVAKSAAAPTASVAAPAAKQPSAAPAALVPRVAEADQAAATPAVFTAAPLDLEIQAAAAREAENAALILLLAELASGETVVVHTGGAPQAPTITPEELVLLASVIGEA